MNYLSDEQGQGMLEYGLLLVLLAIAAMGALGVFRSAVQEMYESSRAQVDGIG